MTNCRRIRPIIIAGALALLAVTQLARASIVVDHPPHPFGGGSGDTSFQDLFGHLTTATSADEFRLDSTTTIHRVVWWGFYYYNILLTVTETMRIRMFDVRADGLPGNVLFEESFVNPVRTWTGNRIGLLQAPLEFRYETALTVPVTLQGNRDYYFEVAQLGDSASWFISEFSRTDLSGFAQQSEDYPDWTHTTGPFSDLAFQLHAVPVPPTGSLFGIVAVFVARRAGS